MNKRGELTSEQIIAIVLAIIGFIIIIAFLTQIGTEDYSTDEICRLSVLSRATAAEALPGAQQGLPLQCSTKKICLSASGNGECPQFIGEKDIVNVKLPSVKEGDAVSERQQAIEIERIMAQSMYDCWNILGQGKLDLFNSVDESFLPTIFDQKKSTCVICSRVALANDLSEAVVSKVDLSTYMEKNTIPGSSLTYLQAFTNGATNTYPKTSELTELKETNTVSISGTSRKETAFVFMQIKPTSFGDLVSRQGQIAGLALGTAFIVDPSLIVRGGRLVFTPQGLGIAVLGAGAVLGADAYSAWSAQGVAAGYCGTFTSKAKSKEGCSLLQSIPYSVSDIRNLCGTIEGNI